MFLVNRTCTICSYIWAITNNGIFQYQYFVCPNCKKEKEKKADDYKINHLKEGF